MAVNVIGFVYSGLQICDLGLYLSTGKHVVEHRLRVYFSFALDQVNHVLSSLSLRTLFQFKNVQSHLVLYLGIWFFFVVLIAACDSW